VTEAVRSARLPDGRTLTIRPTEASDADALGRLYATLDSTDLYHRFFSVFHPDRRFLERWATIGERGGLGLIAEVSGATGDPEVVAEAGYVPIPHGNGELGICVASTWRGWMGPYVLDALLCAAAERQVGSIEADILWENHPMLALARARGYTKVPSDDPAELRVRIPTGPRSSPPTPPVPRVRVQGDLRPCSRAG
jgi:RimJ/RimL family protein N-acetyltransferase